ncbi:la-related protein 4B-like [Xenia sp. Carnegie-2017]|uniref:la-related protein 4B-like n=1 Tax=Xenia sp. Carnegie-2017 TaxID=2897299 RepID=UPI001F03CD10|nr:la-related protein 4B-like [Xenia sp. Carnegie-2017]
MTSAISVPEVDISNSNKLSSSSLSESQKAYLNPDAVIFETNGSLNEESSMKSDSADEQKAKMPSPLPNPGKDETMIVINGEDSGVFVNLIDKRNIPDHIKPDELPKDELRSLIRQQLEYYFSRENLAGDTYLVSQMDSDQYVLIQIVANFNQMKKLTNDIELVKEAIKESAYLQMDDSFTKMRPNMKRCIVILREVPDSTTVEEVEKLFSGEGCPKYVSCEPANNNYWYIQFVSEECAQKAYRYLREDVKTFKGKPIMARIKAKPIPRAASNYGQKNGLQQAPENSTISSIASPTFRYPISPMYGNQGYSFFPPHVMSQWAAGQHFFDPTFIPTLVNNVYHSHNFGKAANHQGNRAFYSGNRNRNQTRSHRETSERFEKDATPNRPRAYSTNGMSSGASNNTGTNPITNNGGGKSSSSSMTSFPAWRKNEEEYRPGPRARRRRGSSEDIHSSRSPIPQEPQRSKDDSHFNLSNAQFPPLPSANAFNTSDLPFLSSSPRPDYNKVASSPPLSPPVTPTSHSRIPMLKADNDEVTKGLALDESNDGNQVKKTDLKKTDMKKTDTKKTDSKKTDTKKTDLKKTYSKSAQDTKENVSKDDVNKANSTPEKAKETLSEKLSYAQIAQKKAMQVKQQQAAASVAGSISATQSNVQS